MRSGKVVSKVDEKIEIDLIAIRVRHQWMAWAHNALSILILKGNTIDITYNDSDSLPTLQEKFAP